MPKTFMLVVVRSLREKYDDVTYPPQHLDISDSPFKGMDALACCHTLRKLNQETDSELNYYYFIIMDEQSMEDSTVLVAGYEDESKIHTRRVEFRFANTRLGALSTGHKGWNE